MTYKTGDIVRIKGLRDTIGKITSIYRRDNNKKVFYEIELSNGRVMFLSAVSIEPYWSSDFEPATDDEVNSFLRIQI